MSHEITSTQDGQILAELNRSMSSDTVVLLYQVLDALDCYAGCSGNGDSRIYKHPELLDAYKALQKAPEVQPHPPHRGDELISRMEKLGMIVHRCPTSSVPDRELDFLATTLMMSTPNLPITIHFQ